MKVLLQESRLVLVPETRAEAAELASWRTMHANHVLMVPTDDHRGLALTDLGVREAACREPINIVSTHRDPSIRILSNFATTPFVLDDRTYQTVEGFWQGLRFAEDAERRRLSQVSGIAAKRAGREQPYGDFVTYGGRAVRVGSPDHWWLMERACTAKFTQSDAARAALLATAPRPLEHRVRRDSKSIPGVIMAHIWMRIRAKLLARNPSS
jgi:predicted NAD-dependent protein-ADP-ribosyltransferase YbiA (DUF1768 family)